MGSKNAHRSFCNWWSARSGMIILLFLFSTNVWAGPIAAHNKAYKELAGKILAYEKRVQELVVLKTSTKEGPELENILTEIADLQKELVGIKRKRRELRDHVTSTHPKEEILEDLSILKDAESSKPKTASANPEVDKKLDEMLTKLRAQYVRSAKEDEEDYSVEQQVVEDALNKKKKTVQKEAKDEYIRENIKSTLKVK